MFVNRVNGKSQYNRLSVGILILTTCLLGSCGQRTISPKVIGQWKSDEHNITVRTEPQKGRFIFTSASTCTKLIINSEKTVEGNIGSAVIKNGKIQTNWLLPVKMTGVAYTIKCDLIGKIFLEDPMETKEVQFWIGPSLENSETELRYTQGGSMFPMAFIFFSKEEE